MASSCISQAERYGGTHFSLVKSASVPSGQRWHSRSIIAPKIDIFGEETGGAFKLGRVTCGLHSVYRSQLLEQYQHEHTNFVIIIMALVRLHK